MTAEMFDGLSLYFDEISINCAALSHSKNLLPPSSIHHSLSPAVSHIVTNNPSIHNPALVQLSAAVVFVTPEFITASITAGSLQDPIYYSPHPSLICQAMVVSTAPSIPKPDTIHLFSQILAYGGQYQNSQSTSNTHIITTEYDPALADYKQILPDYFNDCFRIGRLLDEEMYLFPEPALLNYNFEDGVTRVKMKSVGQSLDCRKDESLLRFLEHKTFFIHLNDNQQMNSVIESLVNVGAEQVGDFIDADLVILRYRDDFFFQAEQQGKLVGTPLWVRHIIAENRLTNPKSQILHYPCPSTPVVGMEGIVLSVTNYIAGRDEIIQMSQDLGIKFTATLTKQNTHLIAASPYGKKCAKANEWNIHIINHLWLEECYLAWQYKREGKSRFTSFPYCLGKGVGKFAYSPELIDYIMSNIVICSSPVQAESTPKNDKSRQITEEKNEEVLQTQNTPFKLEHQELQQQQENDTPNNTPPQQTKSQKPKEKLNHLQTLVRSTPETEEKSQQKVNHIIATSNTPQLTKSKQPNEERSSKSKENPIPNVQAITGKRTRSTPSTRSSPRRDSKKIKLDVRIIFTGFRPDIELLKGLKKMNIQVVDDVTKSTHIVAQKIARTAKMLLGIGMGKFIVSYKWFVDTVESGVVQDEKEYVLRDSEAERKFGFTMKQTLDRVLENPYLLEGYSFYITPSTQNPTPTLLKTLIETLHGVVIKKESEAVEKKDIVVIGCDDDCSYFKQKFQYHKGTYRDIKMYSVELLLTGILKWELEWDGMGIECGD